jgi:CRP/FNR family transcriptional regulator, cyclic AMP receptor protein
MSDIEQILRRTAFFGGMTDEHFAKLAAGATEVEFQSGATIFKEGQAADRFFLIESGEVALAIHTPMRDHVLETLEPGEVFGWSWLFSPYRWSFDARAASVVNAVVFDGAYLRKESQDDCDLGREMMSRFAEVIADRLQATRLQLLDIYAGEKQ